MLKGAAVHLLKRVVISDKKLEQMEHQEVIEEKDAADTNALLALHKMFAEHDLVDFQSHVLSQGLMPSRLNQAAHELLYALRQFCALSCDGIIFYIRPLRIYAVRKTAQI